MAQEPRGEAALAVFEEVDLVVGGAPVTAARLEWLKRDGSWRARAVRVALQSGAHVRAAGGRADANWGRFRLLGPIEVVGSDWRARAPGAELRDGVLRLDGPARWRLLPGHGSSDLPSAASRPLNSGFSGTSRDPKPP